MAEVTYLGHSGFYIKNGEDGILIDPYLSASPGLNFDFSKNKVTSIIVTHAHLDHAGEAASLALKTGATIIAVFELANWLSKKGARTIGVNIGGKTDLKSTSIRFLNANHSSSNPELIYGGPAAGVLLDTGSTTIYHAGDTGLMAEFSLIADLYKPECSILPVGGYYTMDIKEAAYAAKILRSPVIIPMHYNTFKNISIDIKDFVEMIESHGQKCRVLKAGEYAQL